MASQKRDTAAIIARAARREFAEFGFAGARVARIAARAGVNKQLLFYYYRSKAGLYDAVVASAHDELDSGPPITGLEHHAERLRAEVARLFDDLAGRPEVTRLLLHGAREARGPVERVLRQIRLIVSEGQGLGFFRDDADPDLAARQAIVLTFGYFSLEPLFGTNQAAARPAWRDAAADVLVRAVSW